MRTGQSARRERKQTEMKTARGARADKFVVNVAGTGEATGVRGVAGVRQVPSERGAHPDLAPGHTLCAERKKPFFGTGSPGAWP